ncbi:MAG: hypothetical protein Q4G68_14645 [Planctomycetia bacterium]|nr:hypothetical protein [Planctomycetia bacterium]
MKCIGSLIVCMAVLCLTGCSEGKIVRTSVHGTVTIGGVPVESGRIIFLPESGTDSPSAGAVITNGAYEIDKSQGPAPGQYRVQVSATQKTGKKVKASGLPGGPGEVEETASIIPVKYMPDGPGAPKGAGSEQLTATLEKGANEVNFELDAK